MNRRILFVYPNMGSGYSFHPSIQLLSALAKQNGWETKLLHLHEKYGLPNDPDVLIPIVKEYKPQLIAFTSTDFEYAWVEELARKMKEAAPSALFLLGGKSAIEGKDLAKSAFDAFCVGEAEIPFVELLDRLESGRDFYDIRSMWFKVDDKIIKNPLGEIVTDLDTLPFMDYDIFDVKKLLGVRKNWLSVQFTRGCAFNCTFCYVTADKKRMFKNGYGLDKYLRKNSAEYSIRLLEHLCEKYPGAIKVFNMDDELPVMHKDWWAEFCRKFGERIYKKYGIEFTCNARIDIMTEDTIKLMSASGCREVRMGFESGSFRIRKDILNKPISEENMIQVYRWCDKYGIRASSFTMIAIPTEDEESLNETVRLTALLKPYLIRLTFCYPFENTLLWDYVIEHDLLDKEKYMKQSGYFEESPLKWPKGFEQTLMVYRYLFPWIVNTIMLPRETAQMYAESIGKFKDSNFREKKTLDAVIALDMEMSACVSAEHFCYFEGNPAYFHCKNKEMGARISHGRLIKITE